MADVRALVDVTTEQTEVADAALLYVATAGVPAKITWANLMLAARKISASDIRFLDTNDDEILSLFDEGGAKLSYRGIERLLASSTGVDITGTVSVGGNVQPYTIAAAVVDVASGTPSFADQVGFNATITDNGAGDFSFTFDDAEADTDYLVFVTPEGVGRAFIDTSTKSTAGFSVRCTANNGDATDPESLSIEVKRITIPT